MSCITDTLNLCNFAKQNYVANVINNVITISNYLLSYDNYSNKKDVHAKLEK